MRTPLLAIGLWVAACQGVLGIEERTLDVAELSERGYEGCEPGKSVCNACTSEWHRCVCEGWNRSVEEELRAECSSKAPAQIRKQQEERWAQYLPENRTQGFDQKFCQTAERDSCVDCFCEDCDEPVSSCADDPGCRELMDCAMETQCDPKLGGDCAAAKDCQALIDEFGGPEGPTADRFQSVIGCMQQKACPCGENGEPFAPPQCDPSFGCAGCAGCFESCRCDGRSVAQCESDCGLDPMGPLCSPANGCDCADCKAECQCMGKSASECDFVCSTNLCSPGKGCECGTCLEKCLCEGLSLPSCEAECQVVQPNCNIAGGCQCGSCQGDCICRGGTPADCEQSCVSAPPITVTCGTAQCMSYVPPAQGKVIQACCAGANRCGFDMSMMFGPTATCAPTNEGGMSCAMCPDFPAPSPPWAPGEMLQGCCRTDGICGYFDPLLPLGCALPRNLGQSVRAETTCSAAACMP